MKKIVFILMCVFLISGCGKMLNTPTKKVEMFLENYQTLDADVINDLDKVVAEEESFNANQRETYKKIIKKHYQDLTYVIKDETINGDEAVVTVEITVNDFSKVMSEAESYLKNHPEEFNDDQGKYSETLFVDYKLKKLESTTDKVKYTLKLGLTKTNDEWKLNDLTSADYEKINGIYNY